MVNYNMINMLLVVGVFRAGPRHSPECDGRGPMPVGGPKKKFICEGVYSKNWILRGVYSKIY